MATELVPVVDLRLLSQAELNTLSLSCPNAFDPCHCDDIVVPKIDRSVFNESAGSRKQTYSRLRLAPRKPDGPPSSSSSSIAHRRPRGHLSSSPHCSSATAATDGAGAEDHNPGRRNQQIVSFLHELFARKDSSTPPPQVPSQSQTLALTVRTPISAHRNPDASDSSSKALVVVDDRDREVLNAKGVVVDLVGLGDKVDPVGEELRRRTAGLKAEEELLQFLSGLEGQWGSQRKRSKLVDASVVGDDLPRGWKLLLELKRKEGVAWLNCRRYVSPNGKYFVSCKEVSSYILSLIGHPNDVQSVSVLHDGSTRELDKLAPKFAAGLTHQEDITRENRRFSSVTPLASYSDNNQKQVVLNRVEKQTMNDLKNILECHACNLTFGDKDAYLQHQLFHQRSAKRRRLGKSFGDGVIVKDGKYECQFCHKTFNERHRYNGHIGAHVRYQGLRAEALPDNIMTRKIFNPSPLAAVLHGFSETDLAKQNEESCNAKSADELHVDSFQWETKNPEIDHNANSGGSQTTEAACTNVSADDQNNDHNLTSYRSDEMVQERNITDDKSASGMDGISPFVVDVNNVAQNCSRVTTREVSTSKSVDDQANNIDMIDYKCEVVEASNVGDLKRNDSEGNDCNIGGYKLQEVIKSSNAKDVKPDAWLDAMSSPLKNVDIAACETITEIGPSTTSISVDNINNDCDMTDYKSEEVVDIDSAVGVKPTSPIDYISTSLFNVDTMTCETNKEIDLSSCTVIPEIGKYGTDEKVNSESHLITISGNESSYGIETYANDILTGSMEENIFGELDTSVNGLKTDVAGCHSLSDKEPVTENIMPDEFNASYTDTSLVSGHTGVIETDAHCTFDIDAKESVLEEMYKPGNVLENCFGSSNAGCEEAGLSDDVAYNDGTNSLQGNVAGTSSLVHSADGVPILDAMPEQIKLFQA